MPLRMMPAVFGTQVRVQNMIFMRRLMASRESSRAFGISLGLAAVASGFAKKCHHFGRVLSRRLQDLPDIELWFLFRSASLLLASVGGISTAKYYGLFWGAWSFRRHMRLVAHYRQAPAGRFKNMMPTRLLAVSSPKIMSRRRGCGEEAFIADDFD